MIQYKIKVLKNLRFILGLARSYLFYLPGSEFTCYQFISYQLKHALIDAGLLDMIKQGKKVYDEMDNEVGLSGELTDGAKIYIR